MTRDYPKATWLGILAPLARSRIMAAMKYTVFIRAGDERGFVATVPVRRSNRMGFAQLFGGGGDWQAKPEIFARCEQPPVSGL